MTSLSSLMDYYYESMYPELKILEKDRLAIVAKLKKAILMLIFFGAGLCFFLIQGGFFIPLHAILLSAMLSFLIYMFVYRHETAGYKSLFKEVQRRDFDGDEVNTYPCGMVGYRDPFVGGFKRDELQCIVAGSNSEGISRLENFGGVEMNIHAHKLTPEECLERGMDPYNPNRDFDRDYEGDRLCFELPIAPKDCSDE